jgi:2-methylisocitrate lyase-like PEP mutase family enzyme
MTQTANNLNQQERAKQFYQLHHSGKLLVLPNIWDSLGAILLESLGYPAVATASFSIAFTNGYDDGEKIPFEDLLSILKKITGHINIPVTADIESGFAEDDNQLEKNIQYLLETGIVGINIEDTDKKTSALLPAEIHCQKIRLIKDVSEKCNVPLFINARTDVYTRGKDFNTAESRFEETIKRGLAYKAAGADCFFPLAMHDENEIQKAVELLQMSINILIIPGVPELNVLHKMGVARVSLGPSFLKIAIRAMKNLAVKLQRHEGLRDIVENEITSDYLRDMVNKK